MKASYIEYRDTKRFSSGLLRYLDQDGSLQPFYSHPPNLNGFKKLVANKKVTANRVTLVKVLQQQYAKMQLHLPDSITKNIQLLGQENTFTVTTGHQLNLFTGPLYFIYKIATAIKLAQELKAEFPDKNFVPVYWMATEDHDFEEINHAFIGGKKISWDIETKGACGRLSTQGLSEVLKAYQGILGVSPNALQLASWIKEAYAQQHTLADATRYLVHKLFENYGLLIIDADHPELKKQFIEVMEADIMEQHSAKLISETNTQLKATGIEPPVNSREINFFYVKGEIRERIVYQNGQYQVLNTTIQFTEAELRKHINERPENFSPNVVMRPLYQESILPNLAYIGGGAEILYWLELKSTFSRYNLDFPVLLLRNSAQLITEQQEHQIKRLGLEAIDLFQSLDELKKTWILKNSTHNLSVAKESEAIKSTFTELKDRAKTIDPTLVPSTEAIEVRLFKAMERLEKKMVKAEKRNHEEAMIQLEKLHNGFFYQDGLQERSENFGMYFTLFGQSFVDQLISAFQPLNAKFTLLTLSK